MSDQTEDYAALVGRLFADHKLHVVEVKTKGEAGICQLRLEMTLISDPDIDYEDLGRLTIGHTPDPHGKER